MSVRKRTWVTAKGAEKTAWVVDYLDAKGKRRLRTFQLKKIADAFAATASVEVRDGVHVAERETVTVQEAGELWLKSCGAAGLERSTLDQYAQHVRLHIKRATVSLGSILSDAQERGLVVRNDLGEGTPTRKRLINNDI
jgi:hypothetical protein